MGLITILLSGYLNHQKEPESKWEGGLLTNLLTNSLPVESWLVTDLKPRWVCFQEGNLPLRAQLGFGDTSQFKCLIHNCVWEQLYCKQTWHSAATARIQYPQWSNNWASREDQEDGLIFFCVTCLGCWKVPSQISSDYTFPIPLIYLFGISSLHYALCLRFPWPILQVLTEHSRAKERHK